MNLRRIVGAMAMAMAFSVVSGTAQRGLGLRHTGGDIVSKLVSGLVVSFVAVVVLGANRAR